MTFLFPRWDMLYNPLEGNWFSKTYIDIEESSRGWYRRHRSVWRQKSLFVRNPQNDSREWTSFLYFTSKNVSTQKNHEFLHKHKCIPLLRQNNQLQLWCHSSLFFFLEGSHSFIPWGSKSMHLHGQYPGGLCTALLWLLAKRASEGFRFFDIFVKIVVFWGGGGWPWFWRKLIPRLFAVV